MDVFIRGCRKNNNSVSFTVHNLDSIVKYDNNITIYEKIKFQTAINVNVKNVINMVFEYIESSQKWLRLSKNIILQDSRSADMFLSSPFSVLATALAYLHLVKVTGPKLMENRPPFDLKNTILVYNIVQIIMNIYVLAKAAGHILKNPFGCQDLDWSDDPRALDQLSVIKMYFYLKLLDLIDTLFFVLRKSYRQVTFLHLYHHFGMTLSMWVATRFFPGGMTLWIPMINGFVHVVMFVYYTLTVLDSSWKQSSTFKKRLTQIQLIQFIIILCICFTIVFGSCSFPKLAGLLLIPQNLFITVLFTDFYLKTYTFNKKSS